MKASLQQVLTYGQVTELLREMGDRFTPEEAKILLRHPEIWDAMYRICREQYPFNGFKLIHDRYQHLEVVIANTMKRLRADNYDPDIFSKHFRSVPEFDEKDPEVCVVLMVTLDTFMATLRFYWDWAGEQNYTKSYVSPSRRLNEDIICSRYDRPFERYTMRWVRLKLDAHRNRVFTEIEDQQNLAGIEVLAVAAQHPNYFHRSGSKDDIILRMGGLKWTDEGREPWTHTPAVSHSGSHNSLVLRHFWNGADRFEHPTPIILPNK